MKTLIILLSEPSASGNMYGFMAIVGVFFLGVLLMYLNGRQDDRIAKVEKEFLKTYKVYLISSIKVLKDFTSSVDAFYQKLSNDEPLSTLEIKKFSVEFALCPVSLFENRKNDPYPSLSEKIAKFLDGKYDSFFKLGVKHSSEEIQEIITKNAEQLEKIITQELYPVWSDKRNLLSKTKPCCMGRFF